MFVRLFSTSTEKNLQQNNTLVDLWNQNLSYLQNERNLRKPTGWFAIIFGFLYSSLYVVEWNWYSLKSSSQVLLLRSLRLICQMFHYRNFRHVAVSLHLPPSSFCLIISLFLPVLFCYTNVVSWSVKFLHTPTSTSLFVPALGYRIQRLLPRC